MDNKFTRKVIRSFMEERMRNQLVFHSVFPLYELEEAYKVWTISRKDMPSFDTLDDEIDFINAIIKYLWPNFCKKYIQSEGVRAIEFFLDPCDSYQWDKAMNKITESDISC